MTDKQSAVGGRGVLFTDKAVLADAFGDEDDDAFAEDPKPGVSVLSSSSSSGGLSCMGKSLSSSSGLILSLSAGALVRGVSIFPTFSGSSMTPVIFWSI